MRQFPTISSPALVMVYFIALRGSSLALDSGDEVFFVQQDAVEHMNRSRVRKRFRQNQRSLKHTQEEEDIFQHYQDAIKQLQDPPPKITSVQGTDDLVRKLSTENLELHAKIRKLEMELQSLRDGKVQLNSVATGVSIAKIAKEDRMLKSAKESSLVNADVEASEDMDTNAEHDLNQCYAKKTKISNTLQKCLVSQAALISTNRKLMDAVKHEAKSNKNQMDAPVSQDGQRCQEVIDTLLGDKSRLRTVNEELAQTLETAEAEKKTTYEACRKESQLAQESLKTEVAKAQMETKEAYVAGRKEGQHREDSLKKQVYELGNLVKSLSTAEAQCRTEMEKFEGLLGQVEDLKQQMTGEGDTKSSSES